VGREIRVSRRKVEEEEVEEQSGDECERE